jgi:raffinose/stachyose/melibiose transport system permease protein
MKEQRITWRNLNRTWIVLAMLAPTVVGVAIFSYTPAIEAIRHSFYEWDGRFLENFTGLENFRRLLGDLGLWGPLLLYGVFAGLAPLLNWPRLRRGCRVVALVGLLAFALAAGRDLVAAWHDDGAVRTTPLAIAAGLLLIAPLCALGAARRRSRGAAFLRFLAWALPFVAGLTYIISVRRLGDWLLWRSFSLIFILVAANLLKMWPSIFVAVCIHRLRSDRWQYVYRVLFVIPLIIPHMVALLIWKFFYDPNVGPLNKFLTATHLDSVLIWLDKWVFHLGVFTEPFKPAWLADPELIIPALIFWGFPWVGVVGVLIYLAGLQNINKELYEAAELDGVRSWGKFWRIELPLIMTQVRLNLVLMIIGTFQAYGFQLVLLGPEGGPRNVGLTPGLYMYFQGFIEQRYGYACAIGLLLFCIILALTIVNQKYVRVAK